MEFLRKGDISVDDGQKRVACTHNSFFGNF